MSSVVTPPHCRGCGASLDHGHVFADLGAAPLANRLIGQDQLDQPEIHYRLRALVCKQCLLVQLPVVDTAQASPTPGDLFPAAYPFRSGMSVEWLAHCKRFAEEAATRFGLGPLSRVIEIGSNDGAGLLRFRGLGIPALGVEPCEEVAREALGAGISTLIEWWTEENAIALGVKANLVIARNVLAHVPTPIDFLRGVCHVLAPGAAVAIEVPYVRHLMEDSRWDQIYHEHHCYFSLWSLGLLLLRAGLRPYDVDFLPIHGGSIRVYAERSGPTFNNARWSAALETEQRLHTLDPYLAFAQKPAQDKAAIWHKLSGLTGKRVLGYGASAKAATLLNYCGIGPETISAVIDTTSAKWGTYLPGSRIPVLDPHALASLQPEVVINFCWNWPEAEKHIRIDCPGAEIVDLP